MSRKQLIWIMLAIGSAVGGAIPALWGDDFLSLTSVLLSGLGAFAGIWLAFKLSDDWG